MKKFITILMVIAAMFASKGITNSMANGDGFTDIDPAYPAIPSNFY
jgi:hypothetical protein